MPDYLCTDGTNEPVCIIDVIVIILLGSKDLNIIGVYKINKIT